jgi:CelD/BcsL family acetyltransferase involved in cellulose biosynthesis
MRLVTSVAELDELADEWGVLLAQTPLASGFQAVGWVRACWETSLQAGARPYILVAERRGVPFGIAPMALGRSGDINFIGAAVSNYGGPVVATDQTADFCEEWREHMVSDPAVHSVDLAGLREGTPVLEAIRRWRAPGWGTPHVVMSNVCPEVDLSAGWDALMRRHKSRERSNWEKKARRLRTLGSLTFLETEDQADIRAALPELFRLHGERWAQRWTSGAFSPRGRSFQLAAAGSGVERLSLMRLDNRIIAFSLGIRFGGITTSYVLAHDDRFGYFSPGLLLLLRILEAAAWRGDPAFDFSLGQMGYKTLWADQQRPVFRVFWGRGSAVRAARQRAWVKARSIGWLHAAKIEGPLALYRAVLGRPIEPDGPGILIPSSGAFVLYRAAGDLPKAVFQRDELGFDEMERLLSPRAVRAALARQYRGDRLHAIRHGGILLGFAWLASEARRRALLAEATGVDPAAECWYQPIGADHGSVEDLVVALLATPGAVVASNDPISDRRVEVIGRATVDLLPT